MNRTVLRFCFSILSASFVCSSAMAQSRPAMHWSTFNKQASQCACHLFARDALRKEGLNTVYEDTGSILLAGNDRVVAEVVCLPGDKQIRLSAYSTDSRTAELTRNRVRESIVKAHLFDTCP